MKRKLGMYRNLCMVIFFHLFAYPLLASSAESCLHYAGEPVTLSGKIVKRTFFGPPNYGESPNTDSRETQLILLLTKPICVYENPSSYEEAEKNQSEVTLVFPDEINIKKYIKKQIFVFGNLFHAQTGHHHTPVLIDVIRIEQASDCMNKAEAANVLINEYIKYLNDVDNNKTKVAVEQWIENNKHFSKTFKKAYRKLVDDANKQDTEMGLDFDPVVNAQDYPDKGFTIDSCDQSNFVTLKGKGWETFKVNVKIIETKAGWLLDGAGVINMD